MTLKHLALSAAFAILTLSSPAMAEDSSPKCDTTPRAAVGEAIAPPAFANGDLLCLPAMNLLEDTSRDNDFAYVHSINALLAEIRLGGLTTVIVKDATTCTDILLLVKDIPEVTCTKQTAENALSPEAARSATLFPY